MKLRTLAVLAISGLFATTLAFAAPTGDDSSSMSGTNGTADSAGAGPMSGNVGSINNDMQPQANAAGSNQTPMDSSNPSDSSNSNDDMSADTATGDDDY